jgi:hypothetical protein
MAIIYAVYLVRIFYSAQYTNKAPLVIAADKPVQTTWILWSTAKQYHALKHSDALAYFLNISPTKI